MWKQVHKIPYRHNQMFLNDEKKHMTPIQQQSSLPERMCRCDFGQEKVRLKESVVSEAECLRVHYLLLSPILFFCPEVFFHWPDILDHFPPQQMGSSPKTRDHTKTFKIKKQDLELQYTVRQKQKTHKLTSWTVSHKQSLFNSYHSSSDWVIEIKSGKWTYPDLLINNSVLCILIKLLLRIDVDFIC